MISCSANTSGFITQCDEHRGDAVMKKGILKTFKKDMYVFDFIVQMFQGK